MKPIFALFLIGLCSVIAEDAPYPPSGWRPQQRLQQQRALLVLPPQYAPQGGNSQPTQEAESLDKVNENVMERLRQEEGSDTGVYHVYLPDGRLQRVQYTTAPVRQQDGQQNSDANNYQPQQSFNNPNYQPSYNQYRQYQPNANIQTNHQEVGGSNQNSFQGNQQQFNKYQPQQFDESRQQAYTAQYQAGNRYQPQSQRQQFGDQQPFTPFQGEQYLTPSATQQNQQAADKKEPESGSPSQLLAQYRQDKAPASSYVASVQFMDVPPITGPIFAYSPSPLVRIVRYAKNYQ